ncbi:MAG: hypothetical protein WBA67_15050 [Jannaschia sp.]
MICAPAFDDDDADDLRTVQEDVYGTALRVIVTLCNSASGRFRPDPEETRPTDWGKVERFDHRTLQNAHDLLAAAWRYRRKITLAPDRSFWPSQPPSSNWLSWLQAEIGAWQEQPHLVRGVLRILSHQNVKKGYAAEARLALDIMARFDRVPWHDRKRDAHERSLARLRAEVVAGLGEQQPLQALLCECFDVGRPFCGDLPCRTASERAARESRD